jgi:hypothetical protein
MAQGTRKTPAATNMNNFKEPKIPFKATKEEKTPKF